MAIQRFALRPLVNRARVALAVTALVLNTAFTPGFVVVQKIDTAGAINASIAALEAEIVRRGGELNGNVLTSNAQPQPSQPDSSQHHWYAMKLERPSGDSTGSQGWEPVTVGFYSDTGQIVGELSAAMRGGCSERRIAVERANALLEDIVKDASQRSGITMRVHTETKWDQQEGHTLTLDKVVQSAVAD